MVKWKLATSNPLHSLSPLHDLLRLLPPKPYVPTTLSPFNEATPTTLPPPSSLPHYRLSLSIPISLFLDPSPLSKSLSFYHLGIKRPKVDPPLAVIYRRNTPAKCT